MSSSAPPPEAATAPTTLRRRRCYVQLWFWVLTALAAGVIVGLVAPGVGLNLRFLADSFIQLIKVVAPPIVFCTIVVGIASIGNLLTAGRLAATALGYFLTMTLVALTLGLAVVNIVRPGTDFPTRAADPSTLRTVQEDVSAADTKSGLLDFVQDSLLPKSLFGPFVENEILRVIVLAILFAIAASMLTAPLRRRVVAGVELITKLVFGVIRLLMWLAPIAAFGGMAYTVSQFGGRTLANLGLLMAAFWLTCLFFVLVVLGAVCLWSGFNIFKFLRMIKDELLIIVGTSTSETVLPRLLGKLEAAGASRSVVSMVLPTGYAFNLDGTCIYLTMGALFVAQAGGVELPIGAQIGLVLLMLLTSKGAAGVTGAGLVTLAASLQAFGPDFFPAPVLTIGLALLVGIDRIMSEGRSLTNAIGNAVAVMVVARWLGERDEARFRAALDDPSLVRDRIEQDDEPEPHRVPAGRPAGETSRPPDHSSMIG
ncbi:cation:dicarboxylase symporter family transporter [Amycolatopsis rhabdoformis]|uniref:Cation:dicarboxylase symporter family transporter n=1 Tax=Amycolatopsis rhabdoformis TaxID=1448059 RepID=A0ABZ1IK31_9PSEU|nr:cation:dicarboxylase symporter family transporter [Amycolatopsis rhabdoformis]WSE34603.1 cation:dicarboxylase symporter family transporter [Amycolatopsis rhabdoformis]